MEGGIVGDVIWTSNQDFSLICVQLQKTGVHPVLNGGKAAVQRFQVTVIFWAERDTRLRIISVAMLGHEGEVANNTTKGQQRQTEQNRAKN